MKGKPEFPPHVKGLGDVLSHLSKNSLFPSLTHFRLLTFLATSIDLAFDGRKVHFTMLPNPSHLEV